jgi:glycosyltransferase involved in cell wall biosynthesis
MKKKILLLSDDLRIHSGIGTMSKEFVLGTLHKFDWVQMAGAIKHPDVGKVADLSEESGKLIGDPNAYLKVYPVNGYGDQRILRQVIELEKPDGIMHFTDPRFWGWLYAMEHELRQTMPLMYYNIWDDLPFPHWNENAYESCDGLMAISKQTYNINRNVCQRKPRVEGKDLFYVPHGINENIFYPILGKDDNFENFKSNILAGKELDFTILFNSRNIRRKGIADLISAYADFTKDMSQEQKDKISLILHTDPVDENGTDLPKVAQTIAPNRNIIFSNSKMPAEQLNYLYNIADVVCQPSSAEGFGLSHMEAMMTATPTIATVIGGLQDQMGFKVDGNELNTNHFTGETPSNSTGLISKEHGEWVYPLWPNLSLQGSPPTPYIYDSRPEIKDISKGLQHWYNMPKSERKIKGIKGRDWAIKNGFTAKGMCDEMINGIQTCLSTFEPRKKYILINTSDEKPIYKTGVLA